MDQQLLKGHSKLLILAALRAQPMHGYALSQYLKAEMAETFQFGVGMLYPLLHKLEKERYIVGQWEGAASLRKRVYHITAKGRKELQEKKREWANMASLVQKIIHPSAI